MKLAYEAFIIKGSSWFYATMLVYIIDYRSLLLDRSLKFSPVVNLVPTTRLYLPCHHLV
jgi:hypothetical protein